MKMKNVREVMTSNVEYCEPNAPIYEVAQKMKQEDVGIIPVCTDNKLAGVITDRDIVIRGFAEKKPGSTPAEEVMSVDLCTVNPDTTISEAVNLMGEYQVRRLPVVEHDNMIGMISLGDIATEEGIKDRAEKALTRISI
jgi:CBS domain-containing protein